jgi:hypothetical protein
MKSRQPKSTASGTLGGHWHAKVCALGTFFRASSGHGWHVVTMTESRRHWSQEVQPRRRVTLIMATLLALIAIVAVMIGDHRRDDRSYDAGYAAASDSGFVRTAMASPGVTSSTLCDALVAGALIRYSGNLARDGFVTGCRHAVADAME